MAKLLGAERRKKIIEKLHKDKIINVKELSKEMDVSEATLRTDLTKLEKDGDLIRTHGGAMLVEEPENDTSFSTRVQKNKNEKYAIAQKAFNLITENQCIMLDASSTTLELAKIISQSQLRLTVLTNGINTALELSENPNLTVILLGGILRRGSFSVEGGLGAGILNQIHIDVMFTSANGFTMESGLTDFSVYEVELKKVMINAADRIVALLDHTKIGRNSISSFASVSQIDTLITDGEMSEQQISEFTQQNIKVISP